MNIWSMICRLLPALIWAASGTPGWAQKRPQQALEALEYRGEYFGPKDGAFYLKSLVVGMPQTPVGGWQGEIRVVLQDLIRPRELKFTVRPGAPSGRPRQVWKAPAGKYELRSVTAADIFGATRVWRSPAGANRFVVARQSISNLGLWTLQPDGAAGLSVEITKIPNSYRDSGPASESSVSAVIDGFSGATEQIIGGQRVVEEAKSNYSDDKTLRASFTIRRQISMLFKLDLFKHNGFAKDIAETFSIYDPTLRLCYTNRLEADPGLSGSLQFSFILSKATGMMAKIKPSGGTLQDGKLVNCLMREMAQMQFSVADNMIGELLYTFEVR